MKPPPYRIETDRLVIRCYDPKDAFLVKESVDESIEHLRPWLPWAQHEPTDIEAQIDLLRTRGRGPLQSNQSPIT